MRITSLFKKGRLFFLIFVLSIIIIFFSGRYFSHYFFKSKNSTKISFVGDIMLARHIENIFNKENDPSFHFLLTADYLRESDITFGNLEGPISSRGENMGSTYSFRFNPDVINGLLYSGFDVMSIANNHIYDWGEDAFFDTINYLEKNNIYYSGGGNDYESAHKPVKIKKNNELFCFLSYSQFSGEYISGIESRPSIAFLDKDQIINDINHAKAELCNSIFVSLHWGNEYETKSLKSQKELAKSFIDAGALAVIGHHPHVVQEIENYKDGIIAYSLGNFIFDQNFSDDTGKGLILTIEVKDGKILSHDQVVINFNSLFQPFISGAV